MAYRNGTYIAFHANGTDVPVDSDIKYYNMLKAWTARHDDFALVNSHDKASAVRDSSKRATLRASLLERLRNSKNMLLIIGETTKYDNDWVPFEIESAVDGYGLPIIAAYPGYEYITAPGKLGALWPPALAQRISGNAARVIHIPFKKAPITDSIAQFDHNNLPRTGVDYYSLATYKAWGLA